MIYTIEVHHQKKYRDRHGEHVRHDVGDLGIGDVPQVTFAQVYRLDGALNTDDVRSIAERLLTDPITEAYSLSSVSPEPAAKKAATGQRTIEVWLKQGVTDTVAESVIKAVKDLGITADLKVKTGQRYVFQGPIRTKTMRQVAERLLANPMVQEYTLA